jgi:hypothetical protein
VAKQDGDLSPLDMAAISMHELYVAFRRAGFSRSEATSIIAKTAAEVVSRQLEEQADAKDDKDPDKP